MEADVKNVEEFAIMGAQNFQTTSMDTIYKQNLSPETEKMGQVVVNNRKQPIGKFLKSLNEMIKSQKEGDIVQDNTIESTFRSGTKPISNLSGMHSFTADETEHLKIEPQPNSGIPFLNIRPFHTKISNQGKLGLFEKEIFRELVDFKKQQIRMKCKQIFKGQDKRDMNYDKTIDMRDNIMRNVRYEYLKKLQMPNFKRDARKFIIDKRNIKDPSIQMAESLFSDFNHKKYRGEFMDYLKALTTHDRRKNINLEKVKYQFKQLFLEEYNENSETHDKNGDERIMKELMRKMTKDVQSETTDDDVSSNTLSMGLL